MRDPPLVHDRCICTSGRAWQGGPEVADALEQTLPGVPVLYVSGYADRPLPRSPRNGPAELLHKPFTPNVLAARIRALLD